jgi:hypothetical protein
MDKRYTWLTSAVCISLAIFVFLAVGELLADAISANICKQEPTNNYTLFTPMYSLGLTQK